MSDLDKTLEERGNRYGSFDSHAEITMRLKRQMEAMPKWLNLQDDQAESLHMIAHKIGRILNGDPDYADSWVDIAGYAQLVANRLLAKEAQSANPRSACESKTCDAAKVAEPDADGWIEHCGGQRPVDLDTVVDVKFHNPEVLPDLGIAKKAKTWNWGRGPGGMLTDLCIVAYRLVKEEPQWPMVSEPGDHSKIKAAYKPGMEWGAASSGAEAASDDAWLTGDVEGPSWNRLLAYAIRPAQGAQA